MTTLLLFLILHHSIQRGYSTAIPKEQKPYKTPVKLKGWRRGLLITIFLIPLLMISYFYFIYFL